MDLHDFTVEADVTRSCDLLTHSLHSAYLCLSGGYIFKIHPLCSASTSCPPYPIDPPIIPQLREGFRPAAINILMLIWGQNFVLYVSFS